MEGTSQCKVNRLYTREGYVMTLLSSLVRDRARGTPIKGYRNLNIIITYLPLMLSDRFHQHTCWPCSYYF